MLHFRTKFPSGGGRAPILCAVAVDASVKLRLKVLPPLVAVLVVFSLLYEVRHTTKVHTMGI
jgi:hypothetical protein